MKAKHKSRVKLILTGKKLKTFREKWDMTQKELAEQMRTSESSIAMKERGEREITLEDEFLFNEMAQKLTGNALAK